ncbi:MAG TPA: hypothetical protein VFM18_07650 [Methanosarcina sp.]|nr:hypothetical protein [Methanosarcina sp.]
MKIMKLSSNNTTATELSKEELEYYSTLKQKASILYADVFNSDISTILVNTRKLLLGMYLVLSDEQRDLFHKLVVNGSSAENVITPEVSMSMTNRLFSFLKRIFKR